MYNDYSVISDYSFIVQKQHNELIEYGNTIINQWNNVLNSVQIEKINICSNFINDYFNLIDKQYILPKVDEIFKWEVWHKLYLEDERKHKEDGHNFNIFYLLRDEFGFSIKETMHSKLMKFLLNPFASHGQGNNFLIDFLQLLEVENPAAGTWFVTAEEGRIDILLKRNNPHSVIIIENKSNWATDQPNQLYRYWYQEIFNSTKNIDYKFYIENKNKYQIIYLPPNEYKNYEEQSITKPKEWSEKNLPNKIPMDIKILYFNKEIQIWLENCKMQLPEKNYRIREYITQYQFLCNKL
jgi:hypothetical protein